MHKTVISDEAILATADPALMLDKRVQLAHDRMMLCTSGPNTEEYENRWHDYLASGADRSMIDNRIDNDNWRRHYLAK